MLRSFDVKDVHNGYTPLMIAASEGHFRIVHKLIDSGANVKLLSKSGENVYDIAKSNIARHLKSNPNSASTDDSHARYNHALNEMLRRLYCILNEQTYKPKKYKKATYSGEVEMDVN